MFIYQGCKYKKIGNKVPAGMVLPNERLYTNEEVGLVSYSCKCAPFLGGQFQSEIAKYMLSYKEAHID